MVWEAEDENAVTDKIQQLNDYYDVCNNNAYNAKKLIRKLDGITGVDPKDIDGSELDETRRMTLKDSFLAQATELLP